MPQTEVRIPKARVEAAESAARPELERETSVTVIRPSKGWPRVDFRELWRYRELLWIFVWRDIKVRYKQTAIGAGWAIFQPLFILLALVSALGAGLGLAALNARFRDVPYAIPAIMQVLPFLSGVPFSLNGVPPKWQWLLSLNPITTVVSGWRWCLLDAPPPVLGQALLGALVAVVTLFCGLAYFRRSEPRVADTI